MTQAAFPHRAAFASYPMAILALAYALGICSTRIITTLSLPILLSCGGACTVLLFYFFAKGNQIIASLICGLALICLGASLATIEKGSVATDRIRRLYDESVLTSRDPVEVTGVLLKPPEPAPDGLYLTLKVEKLRTRNEEQSASGVVSLFASARDDRTRSAYDALELRYGARISVLTVLSRDDRFRNPGVSSFKQFLDQRGIDATGTIKSPLLIERLNDQRVFLPLTWLYEWRRGLLSTITRSFSPETAGVLSASLLGNRYQLSSSASERFRDGGTFHVLVISGLHISFIGVVVLVLMRRLTSRRGWQFAVTIIVLWSYTLAVGAEASVVRASLMFSLVTLAPLLGRRSSSLNALGGAVLALLIWRPSDLYDPSFQLTFVSVLAIVAVAWPLLSRLRETGDWRPTHESPLPPVSANWWRVLGESLFWSERKWQEEMKDSPWHCRLFKSRHALLLEKFHLQKLVRYVASVTLVSIVVQLALLPFLVLYFHRVSVASILLNIIVGILMALLSFCALAAMVLSALNSSVASLLVTLTELINWLMIHSVDPFESMRLASFRLPQYTGWKSIVYGLYYVPVVFLTIKLNRWKPVRHQAVSKAQTSIAARTLKRTATMVMLACIYLVIWHPLSAIKPDGRLHVDFFDVGQGDSALLTFPDGTTVLVDGGGQPSFETSRSNSGRMMDDDAAAPFERDRRSIGDAVVSEHLWWRGLDQVDYIVATHADADHMDGLNDIARNFKVRSAIVAREPSRDPEYARFATTLHRNGVPIHVIARGDSLRIDDVTIDVLWPARLRDANAPSRNDDSIVFRVRFGERTFLLTGDIERKAETVLSNVPGDLKCDVLKVAHHGSKSSSTSDFVSATKPEFAVISVGISSPYGHPHKEVVERWRASGSQILVTGERGMISVSTDGRTLSVETVVKTP